MCPSTMQHGFRGDVFVLMPSQCQVGFLKWGTQIIHLIIYMCVFIYIYMYLYIYIYIIVYYGLLLYYILYKAIVYYY